MATEKIDMSLDDIIKMDRKKKVSTGGGIRQFRGRVGGKVLRGRGRGSASGNLGVSPLNRKSVAARGGRGTSQVQRNARGAKTLRGRRGANVRGNVSTRGGATARGRSGGRGRGAGRGGVQQSRGGVYNKGARQNQQAKGYKQQKAYTAVTKAKTILKQQSQHQKQNRQNLVNQRRGLKVQSQRKQQRTGSLRSDQLAAQQTQKKRRWGRTNLQRSDSVMTISFLNDPSRKNDSGVRIAMPPPKSQNPQRITAPQNNNQIHVGAVQTQGATSNRRQQKRNQQRKKQKARGTQRIADNEFQVTVASPQGRGQGQIRGQGQTRGRGGRRGRGRGGQQNTGGRMGGQGFNQPSALQQQLKNMQPPTVRTEYNFQRQDFGKAKTSLSLSDRFGRTVSYGNQQSNESQVNNLGGRQVFF